MSDEFEIELEITEIKEGKPSLEPIEPTLYRCDDCLIKEEQIKNLERDRKEINDIIAEFDYELNRHDDDIYGLEIDYVIALRKIKEKSS